MAVYIGDPELLVFLDETGADRSLGTACVDLAIP